MIVNKNESKPIGFKNQSISGLTMYHYAEHDTANTATTLDDSKPGGISVKVELRRNGKSYIVVSDTLQVLHMASNFREASWNLQKVGGTTGQVVLLAAATSVKEIAVWCYRVDFGGTINLSGDDELVATVQVGGVGTSTATDVGTTTSYIDVNAIDGIGGYEFSTPYIDTYWIDGSQGRFTKSLGDNVRAIYMINLDKSNQLSATALITSANISSDRGSITDNYLELVTKNLDLFPTLAEAVSRYQSFELYSGADLDKVTLDLLLVSANVVAAKNVIVVYRSYMDARLVQLAHAKREKHQLAAAVKVGVVDPVKAGESIASASIRVAAHRPGAGTRRAYKK